MFTCNLKWLVYWGVYKNVVKSEWWEEVAWIWSKYVLNERGPRVVFRDLVFSRSVMDLWSRSRFIQRYGLYERDSNNKVFSIRIYILICGNSLVAHNVAFCSVVLEYYTFLNFCIWINWEYCFLFRSFYHFINRFLKKLPRSTKFPNRWTCRKTALRATGEQRSCV